MAGSDHHTALASEFADGIGYLGRGTRSVKEIDLDSVGREDRGGEFSEFARVVAHVIAYGHTYLREIPECVFQIICQTLSCGADSVDVHSVGTGSHDSPESACSEFEILVESIYKRSLVLRLDQSLDLSAGFLVVLRTEPLLRPLGDGPD